MAINISGNTGTNIGGGMIVIDGVDVMKEMDRLKRENQQLREAFTNPKHDNLVKACNGALCYPDELEFILEQYWDTLK